MIFDLSENSQRIGVVGSGIYFLKDGCFLVKCDLYARHYSGFDLKALLMISDSGDDENTLLIEIGAQEERAFGIRSGTNRRALKIDVRVRNRFARLSTIDITDKRGLLRCDHEPRAKS